PLPAARLAQKVRRRAQREKRTAPGKGVDQRLGPPLSGLDAVVVEEADFLLAPRPGKHPHLRTEIAVEALYVNVVIATGIAEKEIKHASSDPGVALEGRQSAANGAALRSVYRSRPHATPPRRSTGRTAPALGPGGG